MRYLHTRAKEELEKMLAESNWGDDYAKAASRVTGLISEIVSDEKSIFGFIKSAQAYLFRKEHKPVVELLLNDLVTHMSTDAKINFATYTAVLTEELVPTESPLTETVKVIIDSKGVRFTNLTEELTFLFRKDGIENVIRIALVLDSISRCSNRGKLKS